MSKRDITLLSVTIALVIALVVGIIWDLNSFVLKRTLDTPITQEMTVESMHKYGIMFYRKAYEAKVKINSYDAERILNDTATAVQQYPEIMTYEEYKTYSEEAFQKQILRPNPLEGTEVVVLKTINSDGDYVTYMFDIESVDTAYIYIYFARD